MFLKYTALAASVFALTFAGSAAAETWTVDPDQSSLGFEVNQGGSPLKGQFDSWTASIDFDPAAPEKAVITAEIQTATAKTGNGQYDAMLSSDDWFATDEFSVANFRTEDVKPLEGGRYLASGFVTIRSVTMPVDLEFSLDIDGDTAHAVGTAKLKRKEFDLGKSVDDKTVDDQVLVTLDLTATK